MFIKLGGCYIHERDIKYIKWTSTTHSNNTRDISAVICFRDGEEIKIMNISDEEKQNVDQYWSDEFINRFTQTCYKGVIKMSKWINQDDIIKELKKEIEADNDTSPDAMLAKQFVYAMITFIENFPTTDIEFKNGTIHVNARSIIKEGAENEI